MVKFNGLRMCRMALISFFALSLTASTGCWVRVQTGPPPAPAAQKRPAKPFPKAVWIPGHYKWENGRYQWRRGHWSQPRRGQVWVPGRWKRTARGWVYVRGHWRHR